MKTIEIVKLMGHGPNVVFENVSYFNFLEDNNNWFYIELEGKKHIYFSKENVMYVKLEELKQEEQSNNV